MTAKLKSKRINTGIYEITIGENVYEIERFNPNDWLLFYMEPRQDLSGGTWTEREYIKDFWTKADAMEWVQKHGVTWLNS